MYKKLLSSLTDEGMTHL